MKIILQLLVLIFTFAITSLNAQFKTPKNVVSSNATLEVDQLEIPKTKKLSNQNSNGVLFQPKSMNFVKKSENGIEVIARENNSATPIFLKGKPELNLRNGSLENKAYNFVLNAKELLTLNSPEEELVVLSSEVDKLGMTHVKMQQVYNGIKVYGAQLIYHDNGREEILNGRYKTTPRLESLTPQLTKSNAINKAIEVGGEIIEPSHDNFQLFDFEKSEGELVIYYHDDQPRLVYHIELYHSIIDKWDYFIDALTGEVVNKYEGICKFHNHHSSIEGSEKTDDEILINLNNSTMPPPDGPVVSDALDLFGDARTINSYQIGNKYYLIDASRTMFDAVNSNLPNDPIGSVWTINAFNTSPENNDFNYDHVSSGTNSFFGNNTGVSAHFNGGEAYEYFKNVHNRESINGAGGNVVGLINISDADGSSLGNAFWNGVAMFYGNGDASFQPLARGLDVAGHEMSHGVIQSTANLEYQGESGALNESFADVFGAMIDRADWNIGEDVVKTTSFPSGALRSLEDPHNGAATGNFNQGWQPRIYSERYTGTQDNGGVHINSGIPNYAFFLFASNANVGKDRAEQVYYRALNNYLTKSSQFIDARLAVVQASLDLYNESVAQAARDAFDAVEIFNGEGTENQTDIVVNNGTDLVLFTTSDQNNLYIADTDGNLIFNPLTEVDPISVPSITDDGSEIVFVNSDNELYYVHIDWATTSVLEEGVIGSNDTYRNAIFSRDGLKLAALRENVDNQIFVYDFVAQGGVNFELFNPTSTPVDTDGDGIPDTYLTTDNVLYADAMQFDFTGEYIMYDAFNELTSNFGEDISYWDIGFLRVFNNEANTFTLGNDIQKLFSQLPEGVSVGNPSFSKNSDYIMAFDALEDNDFSMHAANIETNGVSTLYDQSDRLGYPSYSLDDDKVIFTALGNSNFELIASVDVEDNKIDPVPSSAVGFLGFSDVGVKWGVWFGNGQRILSSNDNVDLNKFTIYPSPTQDYLNIAFDNGFSEESTIKITDFQGRIFKQLKYNFDSSESVINVSNLPTGQYIFTIISEEGTFSKLFFKL